MATITSFPERLKLVRERVAEVTFYYPLSREDEDLETLKLIGSAADSEYYYSYYHFFVTLKDGRCFGFSARTPEYIRHALETDHELSWVESGLVVFSEITVEAMLDAVEKALENADIYGLEHFGFLCSSGIEEPDSDR